MSASVTSRIARARGAAGRGDWRAAFDLLAESDAKARLKGADLALYATASYAVGEIDRTIDSWERAHADALRSGEDVSAAEAAVRVALHLLFDTALIAPVRGWIRRAERLLERHEETPVHGWLAVVRSYERLLSGDFDTSLRWARQGVEIGGRRDPAAAAVARVAEARAVILLGHVSEGLVLLNEAGVAAASGELDPLFTGVVYCEVVCALQGVAQFDLAEQWTVVMERWRQGHTVGSLPGRCRLHRAEILRLRGSFADAERHAVLACEELRPYLRREFGWPLMELGRIRLRMGDLDGAEKAFRSAGAVGWDPQPGLALLHLAKGEVSLALRAIRDAVDHPTSIPSRELPPSSELRRAPLLEAQTEIAVAAGDPALAKRGADELEAIASRYGGQPLAASATLARGRAQLAAGDAAAAARSFEHAAHVWSDVAAPYEAAVARMALATALRTLRNEPRATAAFEAARAGFVALGAVREVAAAERVFRSADAVDPSTAPSPGSVPAGGVFRREGDSWAVGFAGQVVHLRDLKGLHYLARLLGKPGREIHALDLVAIERSPDGGDAGPMLDATAKAAYRRRLSEIDEDLERATTLGDEGRAAQAEAERDFLMRELGRAVGLGGRDRRASATSERARASATRAIRQAMARIHEHHPALGAHLELTIHTGSTCAYRPDPRLTTVWSTEK